MAAYTELEWSLVVQDPAADTYEFRVYSDNAGTALDTYAVTPQLTVEAAGAVSLVVANSSHALTSNNVTLITDGAITFPYPATVSARKILDQNSGIYLLKSMASWAMPQNATNAEITEALEGLQGRGFNAITASPFGVGMSAEMEADKYQNAAGANWFTGTPFVTDASGSGLGPAWSSMDHVMAETARLEMIVLFVLFISWGTTGNITQISAVTNANMEAFGAAVAARYASYPNIMWHVMADTDWDAGDTLGRRIDYYFKGIRTVEGSTHRLIFSEPGVAVGLNTYTQFIAQEGTDPTGYQWFLNDINSLFRDIDHDNAVENFDDAYTQSGATTEAVWESEPIYAHATWYTGNASQQIREKNYTTFFRGGVGINYGDEYFWPAGEEGLFGGTHADWIDQIDAVNTVEASYCWTFIDTYCIEATFGPVSTFVTTGLGSGDTKAAQGASPNVAVAYFPDNRTIVVDTTILTGTGNVRLRWFDPVLGTYTVEAASEAQNASRSVTLPAAHADTSRDFILVVDLVASVTLTVADSSHGLSSDGVTLGINTSVAAPPDLIGILDVAIRSRILARTFTDNIGITDSRTVQEVDALQTTDSVGLTDVSTRSLVKAKTFTDNVGVTDAATRAAALTRTSLDPVGVTDVAPRSVGRARTAVDNVGLTDLRARTTTTVRTFVDNVGLTDIAPLTVQGEGSFEHSDPVGITDVISRGLAKARIDAVGISDSATVSLAKAKTPLDSVGVTDSSTRSIGQGYARTDNVGITDSTTRVLARARAIIDNVGVTDNAVPSKAGQGTRTVGSNVGVTDSVQISKARTRLFVDAIGVHDTAQRFLNDLEAIVLNDALALHLGNQTVSAVYVGSVQVWP